MTKNPDKKAFRIKNRYVIGLASWLNELSLAGRESRERTRFVSLLTGRIKENQGFHHELIEKYVVKDEKGKAKKKKEGEGEVWDIPEGKTEELEKEYLELMEDEFIVDISAGNKAKLKTCKDLVLNTDYLFGPKPEDSPEEKIAKIRQASDYEKWCEAFEELEI